VRPKDDHDAAVVLRALAADRRTRLTAWLGPDHPWSSLMA
jgi:hypothetical protein